jgi:hypothetical protein
MAMTLRKSLSLGIIAKESKKVQKIREKLKARLDCQDKKITPEALETKVEEILNRINRQVRDKILLGNELK